MNIETEVPLLESTLPDWKHGVFQDSVNTSNLQPLTIQLQPRLTL